jgi:sucrose-phosphate synthase
MTKQKKLYIVMINVHGLVRGHDLELGRDADTGGQIKYVMELARALIAHPRVERVDLLARIIIDSKVSDDYSKPVEEFETGAHIIRLTCGPRRYLRKEVLWPYLDSFADQALKHIRRVGRVPDVIHSHYADSGYVGARLSGLLEVPLVHTGHSLGRVKRMRLIDQGIKHDVIEKQYHMSQRIEAEEVALDNAAMVIASTQQEVGQQYSIYDNYQPRSMVVIPPGIDLERFHPPKRRYNKPPIYDELMRFLNEPNKPIIFALSRPDVRKNISTLIRAYGENKKLREKANLVIIAGSRKDIQTMEKGPRSVMTELLVLIDRYDLYGSVAYPKQHSPEDVPDLYRLAADSQGIFVNPALTEPFGLTLLEAAASGLPIVATEDGGPLDIVDHCRNGVLIDPLDVDRLGEVLLDALSNREQWGRWSRNGITGVKEHFSWQSHVAKYLREIDKIYKQGTVTRKTVTPVIKSRLPVSDRLVVCDIDNTLIGDKDGLMELINRLQNCNGHVGFGVATGRRIESARKVLNDWQVPMPDFFISSVGSEIHYGPKIVQDNSWKRHIEYRWKPDAIREAMQDMPGIRMQPKEDQREFKISYFIDPAKAPKMREITRHLRKLDLHVKVIYSHQAFLDLLPVRASKGAALRYLADKWEIPIDRVLVAGDSGNDEEMLNGDTLGVVVCNHSPELEKLRDRDRIYFAEGQYAWGVIQGIEHYDFLNSIRIL